MEVASSIPPTKNPLEIISWKAYRNALKNRHPDIREQILQHHNDYLRCYRMMLDLCFDDDVQSYIQKLENQLSEKFHNKKGELYQTNEIKTLNELIVAVYTKIINKRNPPFLCEEISNKLTTLDTVRSRANSLNNKINEKFFNMVKTSTPFHITYDQLEAISRSVDTQEMEIFLAQTQKQKFWTSRNKIIYKPWLENSTTITKTGWDNIKSVESELQKIYLQVMNRQIIIFFRKSYETSRKQKITREAIRYNDQRQRAKSSNGYKPSTKTRSAIPSASHALPEKASIPENLLSVYQSLLDYIQVQPEALSISQHNRLINELQCRRKNGKSIDLNVIKSIFKAKKIPPSPTLNTLLNTFVSLNCLNSLMTQKYTPEIL